MHPGESRPAAQRDDGAILTTIPIGCAGCRRHTHGTKRDALARFPPVASATVTIKAATPWGQTTVLEELRVPQRAGDRRFETIVQLLEDGKGGELVRFAYSTGGAVRRGPVTLRGRDLERLRSELAARPRLADALGLITP
jgi:hypothetical protein